MPEPSPCLFQPDNPCVPFEEEQDFAYLSYDSRSQDFSDGQTILEVLEEAIEEAELEPYSFRESRERGVNWFCKNICSKIKTCTIFVGEIGCWRECGNDCSDAEQCLHQSHVTNPNVAFEMGLAFTFRKPVIPVIRSKQRRRVATDLTSLDPVAINTDLTGYKRFGRDFRQGIEIALKRGERRKTIGILTTPLQLQKRVLDIESDKSVSIFMLVNNKLSSITETDFLIKAAASRMLTTEEEQNEYMSLVKQRQKVVKRRLKKGDVRRLEILYETEIERYLGIGNEVKLSDEERKQRINQINTLLRLLKGNKDYIVAKTKADPSYCFCLGGQTGIVFIKGAGFLHTCGLEVTRAKDREKLSTLFDALLEGDSALSIKYAEKRKDEIYEWLENLKRNLGKS